MDYLEGAYSLVIMSPQKLIAARDPNGFRPLCMGRRKDGSIVFASETCALDSVEAEFERELDPGEIVIADSDGVRSVRTHCGQKPSLCVCTLLVRILSSMAVPYTMPAFVPESCSGKSIR